MKRADVASEWRQRIRAFEGSGQRASEFCRRAGVSTTTFYKWRRRLAKERGGGFALDFVEVERQEPSVGVELVTTRGMVVRLQPQFDEATLARVLDVLESR